MRYVDHDPAAARRAAGACRRRADDADRIAEVVGSAGARVTWWGAERDRVVDEITQVCQDLRHEAASLRLTADLLEAAAGAAEQRDADLAAQARAAAEAAAAARRQAGLEFLMSGGIRTFEQPSRPPPPPAPTHVPSDVL